MENKLQLIFDPWFMRQRGGIGRDSRAIYREINQNNLFELASSNRKIKLYNWAFSRKFLSIFAGFGFGVYINIGQADAFLESQISGFRLKNRSKIRIIRLHDIFPYTNPEWFRKISASSFNQSLKKIVNFPNTIFLCNSEVTLKNLKKAFPKNKINAIIYPCFVDDLNSMQCYQCKACQNNLESTDKYYVMVGTIEPRKDYNFILRCLDVMGESRPKIIIVGKKGWKCRGILKKFKLEGRVLWFEDCCDGKLREILKNAIGFISTSLDEGFNIPASEARLLGKELFLRDIEIHRLIHDGAAHFFNSETDLASLLVDHKKKHPSLVNSQKIIAFPAEEIFNMYKDLRKFSS